MKSDRGFKLALVTGATSGLGEAMARLLAAKGISLLLTGRNTEALERLKKELGAKVQACDLSREEPRRELLATIEQMAPDLVVNNAGFGLYGDAIELEIEEQGKIVAVNVEAMMEIALKAGKTLKAQGREGVILNVSSAIGFLPGPGFTVYGASKAFVNSFSLALDYELQPYGVRSLACCPGLVRTQFATRAAQGGPRHRSPEVITLTAEEVAEAMWRQIQGGVPLRVVDWKYALLVWIGRCLAPRRLVGKVIYDSIKAKI